MDTDIPHLDDLEWSYLETHRLGRLATVDARGAPQNNPVGFALEPGTGRLLISGWAMGTTRKFRNARDHPAVALVVDDADDDPWAVRGVEIRGTAEARTDVDPPMPGLSREQLRITPLWIAHWGLDDGGAFTRRGRSPGPPPRARVEALLAEYLHRVDTRPGDAGWLADLADDDVEVHFPFGDGRGRADLDAASRAGWERWAATMHRVSDVVVDGAGGFTATLHALHVHHADDPGRPMVLEAELAGSVVGDPARLGSLRITPRRITGDGPAPR